MKSKMKTFRDPTGKPWPGDVTLMDEDFFIAVMDGNVYLVECILRVLANDDSISLVDAWSPERKEMDGFLIGFDIVAYDKENRFYLLKVLNKENQWALDHMDSFLEWTKEYLPLDKVNGVYHYIISEGLPKSIKNFREITSDNPAFKEYEKIDND